MFARIQNALKSLEDLKQPLEETTSQLKSLHDNFSDEHQYISGEDVQKFRVHFDKITDIDEDLENLSDELDAINREAKGTDVDSLATARAAYEAQYSLIKKHVSQVTEMLEHYEEYGFFGSHSHSPKSTSNTEFESGYTSGYTPDDHFDSARSRTPSLG